MSRIRWYGPTVVLLLTVLLVMVMGPGVARRIAHTHTQARVSFIKNSLSDNPFLAELSESFRKVSQAVEPSVVAIQILARADSNPHDAIRRFFGPDKKKLDEFLEQLEDGQPSDRSRDDRYDRYAPPRPIGSGSGWVYRYQNSDDPDDYQDYIITNNHVVRNADQIKVRFHDGAEYEVQVLGTDERTDIAVLTVDASNLVPASIAEEPVQQGDMVFAFGSPLSFDFSMSQGIISATGRELGIIRVSGGGYENFIQTDAMINPGNSGGPLTNIYGEVVGMNTAIAAGGGPRTPGSGTFVGLGFAIPVEMVADIANRIIEDGEVRRGFLGISLPQQDLDERMAHTFGFQGKGVLVGQVNEGGPADRAGIKRGDIITRIDDVPTTTIAKLRSVVAGYKPGVEVAVELFRNGETKTVNVVLDEFPDMALAVKRAPDSGKTTPDAQGMSTLRKLGIAGVQDFTDQAAQQLGVEYFPAVMITSVRPNSVAAAERLQRGMLITHVMGEPVASVDDLIEQIEKHDPSQGIRISVKAWDRSSRSFLSLFIVLQLPENGFITP
jgi:serine protease Do